MQDNDCIESSYKSSKASMANDLRSSLVHMNNDSSSSSTVHSLPNRNCKSCVISSDESCPTRNIADANKSNKRKSSVYTYDDLNIKVTWKESLVDTGCPIVHVERTKRNDNL